MTCRSWSPASSRPSANCLRASLPSRARCSRGDSSIFLFLACLLGEAVGAAVGCVSAPLMWSPSMCCCSACSNAAYASSSSTSSSMASSLFSPGLPGPLPRNLMHADCFTRPPVAPLFSAMETACTRSEAAASDFAGRGRRAGSSRRTVSPLQGGPGREASSRVTVTSVIPC